MDRARRFGHRFNRPWSAPHDGRGLPPEVREKMEVAFQADFSDVRIHPGSSDVAGLGADACTQGSDIYFASGRLEPHSRAGQELLAHELAHVLQQRQNRVSATSLVEGRPVNESPALEREAEAMGARVAGLSGGGPLAQGAPGGGASSPAGPAPLQMGRTRTQPSWKPEEKKLNEESFKKRTPQNKRKWDLKHLLDNTEDEEVDDSSSATETEGSDTDEENKLQEKDFDFSLDTEAEERADKFAQRLWKYVTAEDKEEAWPEHVFTAKGRRKFGLQSKKSKGKKKTKETEPVPREEMMKDLRRNSPKFLTGGEDADKLSRLRKLEESEQKDLDDLNEGYEGDDEEVIEKHKDKFAVPQHRGLFFTRSGWTKESRKRFRESDKEIGKPVYSMSVLKGWEGGVGGFYEDLYSGKDTKKKHKKAEEDAEKIKQERLRQSTLKVDEGMGKEYGWIDNEMTHGSLADEIYVRSYSRNEKLQKEAFERKRKEEKEKPLDKLYTGYPGEGSTRISFADTPRHANKYSFGMKPYGEGVEDLLHPKYNRKGKPSHPYSGATFASLHPLDDYTSATGPRQIPQEVEKKKMFAESHTIAERETQFDGMVGEGRVFRKHLSKFPNLSKDHGPLHQSKYGMNKNLYDSLRYSLYMTKEDTPERMWVEAQLSNHLMSHEEVQATQAVVEEAEERDQVPVFRSGEKKFTGLDVPKLPDVPKKRGKKYTSPEQEALNKEAKKQKANENKRKRALSAQTTPSSKETKKRKLDTKKKELTPPKKTTHFAKGSKKQGPDENKRKRAPSKQEPGENKRKRGSSDQTTLSSKEAKKRKLDNKKRELTSSKETTRFSQKAKKRKSSKEEKKEPL